MSKQQRGFSAANMSCTVPASAASASDDGAAGGVDMKTVFGGLSFAIAPGEIVDLVGPSGAGKSSLLTAFARLNPHADGDLELNGRRAEDFTAQQWRRSVAYLPQKPMLMGDTVADAIRLPWTLRIRTADRDEPNVPPTPSNRMSNDADAAHSPQPHRHRPFRPISRLASGIRRPDAATALPDARIRAMLDVLGCEDIDLGRAPHDLSGGQAARVSLARTLLTEPELLLADEVDAGLDDANADKVACAMADAAAHGMMVVRIRHRPPDGRASRIVTLENGKLDEGRMI